MARAAAGSWLATWRGRSLLSLLSLLALLVALFVMLWLILSNEMVSRSVVGLTIPRVNAVIPGEIRYSSFHGTIGSRVVLENLEILDDRGEPCVRARRLEVDWDLWDLASFSVDISRARLVGLEVLAAVREDGSLNLATAFVASEPLPDQVESDVASRWSVAVRNLSVEGGTLSMRRGPDVEQADLELAGLTVAGEYYLTGTTQRVGITRLEGSLLQPIAVPELQLAGALELGPQDLRSEGITLAWRDSELQVRGAVRQFSDPQLDLAVTVQKLALADFAEFLPSAPLRGVLAGALELSGSPSELAVAGSLRAAGGEIKIQRATLDSAGETLRHELDLELVDLSLAELLDLEMQLPPSLSLLAQWKGQGKSGDDIEGSLNLSAQPFASYGQQIAVHEASLRLRGSALEARRLRIGIAGGEIVASGAASLAAKTFSTDLEATFPALGPLAQWAGLDGSRGRLELAGAVSGSWDPASGTPLRTQGSATLVGGAFGSVQAARLTAEWALAVEPSEGQVPALQGPLKLVADSLSLSGGATLRSCRIDATIHGMLAQYRLRASRDGDLLLSSAGTVDWSRLPALQLRAESLELLAGDFLLQGSEPFVLQIHDGTYQLQGLQMASGEGSLTAQGLFRASDGTLGLTARLRDIDLAPLNDLVALAQVGKEAPIALALEGKVRNLLLKATGTLAAPRIALSGEVAELRMGERGPLDFSASLVAEDGVLKGEAALGALASLELRSLPLSLRLDGAGQALELAPDGPWDIHAQLARSGTSALVPLLGRSLPEELAGGTLRGGLSLSGPTRDLRLRVDMGLSDLEVSGQRLHGQLGLSIEEGQLRFEDALLKTASVGRVLKLEGQAAARPGAWLLQRLGPASYREGEPLQLFHDLEISVGTRKLPMSLVHLLVPALRPLTGALQGQLDLTGQLDQPQARLSARLLDGRVGGEELRELRLDAGLEGGALSAELEVGGGSGGTLRAEAVASMPFTSGATKEQVFGVPDLRAEVVGDGFPLALISAFVPGTIDTSGALRVDGVVSGSLLHPEPQLSLELAGGRLCHELTSVCYEEVALDASLETGRLAVKDVSFRTVPQVRNPLDLVRSAQPSREDSRFRGSGFVMLDGLRPKWTELDLQMLRAWASYTEQIKVQVDGALRIRGYYPALKLSGEAELQNVRVDLGRAATRREMQSLELPLALRIHRPDDDAEKSDSSTGAEAEQRTALDSLLAHSEADITIKLGNNVRTALAVGIAGQRSQAVQALNLLGSIEPDLVLLGEINLRHKKQNTSLVGEVTLGRGSRLKVLTRDFQMDAGSAIEFVGNVPDSQLNLRATYSSRYGPVTVVVSERMASPSIRFESEVFEDQADILSVLVTGKPISELSTAEGTQALSGVAGALAGFGTKAFGKYTPFDSLRVDLGDDLSSGSAEAGKALGPRVFLVTRFRWGTEEGENRIEGQLEVQINPRLYLETVMGDRLQGAVQLVFKRQF